MTKDIKEWEKLIRFPRINGINIGRLAGPSEGGHYQNGLVIYQNADDYRIEDITSENREIKHSSVATFNKEGKLVGRLVNCFTLGFMSMDEGYVQELFEGFLYNKKNRRRLEVG